MLTLSQIIKKTGPLRIEGSKYVVITGMKKGFDSLGRPFVAGASYTTHIIGPYGKPIVNKIRHRYVTVITFLDRQLNVLVSCSCDDAQYRTEYALHSKGAAEIEYSNGEYPSHTNPKLIPYCCKHVLGLYNKIKSQLPQPAGKPRITLKTNPAQPTVSPVKPHIKLKPAPTTAPVPSPVKPHVKLKTAPTIPTSTPPPKPRITLKSK